MSGRNLRDTNFSGKDIPKYWEPPAPMFAWTPRTWMVIASVALLVIVWMASHRIG
jgi:hypothetical protein